MQPALRWSSLASFGLDLRASSPWVVREAAIGKKALVYAALVPSLIFLYNLMSTVLYISLQEENETYLDQVLKHRLKVLKFSIVEWVY
jgi:hypothetical protein